MTFSKNARETPVWTSRPTSHARWDRRCWLICADPKATRSRPKCCTRYGSEPACCARSCERTNERRRGWVERAEACAAAGADMGASRARASIPRCGEEIRRVLTKGVHHTATEHTHAHASVRHRPRLRALSTERTHPSRNVSLDATTHAAAPPHHLLRPTGHGEAQPK